MRGGSLLTALSLSLLLSLLQSFLQTRSSLHQRLILVSVVLLLISGVILLHSVVFSQHQQTTGGTSNTPAVSFASEKDDKAAATATGPAKQMIDLTRA